VVQCSGEAQDAGKVGPLVETVKAFGADFRLVGIDVSAKGCVFVTAPSSDVRSRFSMVEVDPKTGAVTPYPDAAWNNFSEQGGWQVGMDFRAGAMGRQVGSSRHCRKLRRAMRADDSRFGADRPNCRFR
jgi:hypothetical protein